MDEQRVIDIIDWFRSKLAEEQFAHADTSATVKRLSRQIKELESELEGYRVSEKTKADNEDSSS